MSNKPYDLLVIGAGSAGFNAARLAAAHRQRVALLDSAPQLGGLCILRGCMPSKTLLYIAEVLHLAKKAKTFGLKIPIAVADMPAIRARKRALIADFAAHRQQQLATGKWDLHRSHARFLGPHTVELDDGRTLAAKKILIATGSRVAVPPVPGLAETPHWTSDDALDLDHIPESIVILGGGIVACELAQFLRRVGSRVTLVQRSRNILRDHSPAASAVIQQALRDEGIDLHTDTAIEHIAPAPGGIAVRFRSSGKTLTRRAARLLNALGREPNTDGLNLPAAGVRLTPAGRIRTNRYQQTTAPHIYAAGDVAGPHDIVHLAIAQGELAARHALGQKNLKPVDDTLLLNVVFTDPQLATIGLTEQQLTAKKVRHLVATYPFNDHGKSMLMDANYGYVKVIAEPVRGRILGAEIVGKDAGELIHCFSGPLAMRATVRDLLRAPWYHPTLAEIITYPLEEIADQLKR